MTDIGINLAHTRGANNKIRQNLFYARKCYHLGFDYHCYVMCIFHISFKFILCTESFKLLQTLMSSVLDQRNIVSRHDYVICRNVRSFNV